MDIILLANILTLIAQLVSFYASTRKSKHQVLFFQNIFMLIISVASYLLKGYSAIVTNVVCVIRNCLSMKGISSLWITYSLILFFPRFWYDRQPQRHPWLSADHCQCDTDAGSPGRESRGTESEDLLWHCLSDVDGFQLVDPQLCRLVFQPLQWHLLSDQRIERKSRRKKIVCELSFALLHITRTDRSGSALFIFWSNRDNIRGRTDRRGRSGHKWCRHSSAC